MQLYFKEAYATILKNLYFYFLAHNKLAITVKLAHSY